MLRRFSGRLAPLLAALVSLRIWTVVGAVVGGTNAAVGEFPHMALLGRPCSQLTAAGYPAGTDGTVECSGGYEWFCGGSLISSRFVLTAAHCAHTELPNPPTVVRLGEHDLSDGNGPATGAGERNYPVRAIVQHPAYTGILTYNDIALVELERTVTFSRSIQPACLWAEHVIPKDVPLIATGWGKIGHFEEPATILQRVQIPLVSNAQCNRLLIYRNRRLRNGIVPTQLCAGDPLGGKDTCEGDSGGPLQLVVPRETIGSTGEPAAEGICRYQLVGVTSNGGICGTANRPGIYTRVSSFVDWIEQVVWGEKH